MYLECNFGKYDVLFNHVYSVVLDKLALPIVKFGLSPRKLSILSNSSF